MENTTIASYTANIEKILEILRRTNDGDDLEPSHLYFLQQTINGLKLDAEEQEELDKIYDDTRRGVYRKPFLEGFENFTRDHEGYVYYKNFLVEHFSFSSMSKSDVAKQLESLAERCRYLEEINVVPTMQNVIGTAHNN